MRKKYLKFMSFLLTTLGLFLGFSQKVIAQYGVPMVQYLLKGTVYSKANQKPIKGIFMGTLNGDSVFTDKRGYFEKQIYVNDYDTHASVFASDIDGMKNGAYEPTEQQFKITDDISEISVYLDEFVTVETLINEKIIPSTFEDKPIKYLKKVYAERRYSWNTISAVSHEHTPQIRVNNTGKQIELPKFENGELSFSVQVDSIYSILVIEITDSSQVQNDYLLKMQTRFAEYEIPLKSNTEQIYGIIIKQLDKKD